MCTKALRPGLARRPARAAKVRTEAAKKQIKNKNEKANCHGCPRALYLSARRRKPTRHAQSKRLFCVPHTVIPDLIRDLFLHLAVPEREGGPRSGGRVAHKCGTNLFCRSGIDPGSLLSNSFDKIIRKNILEP